GGPGPLLRQVRWTAWSRPGQIHASLCPRRGPGGATLPEYLDGQGDGANGTDQHESPAHGPTLVDRETIRQEETEPGAEGRPRPGDQRQFGQGDRSLSH